MSQELVWTKEEQEKLNKMFEGWMIADHKRKIDNFIELNQTVRTGGVLFVGDSITEGYPIYEMFHQDQLMYNRGISGYRASQIVTNIEHQILALQPKTIFLLVGTNDLTDEGVTPKDIAKNIERICLQTAESLPNSTIYVLSVYPVNKDEAFKDMVSVRNNDDIKHINTLVRSFVDTQPKIHYIDVYETLLLDGQLNPEYTPDGLHLNIKGYRIITDVLKNYLK